MATRLWVRLSWPDYDGDGFDDVFVTDSKAGGKNHLYHNNHDFTFTDVAEKAGVAIGNDANNASADALWFDYNNDGRPIFSWFASGTTRSTKIWATANSRRHEKGRALQHRNAIKAIAFDYDRDG